MKQLNETPLPLKEASLGKSFPAGLDAVLQKLLQKEPEARYQSFEEVAQALKQELTSPIAVEKEQGSVPKKTPGHQPVKPSLQTNIVFGLAAFFVIGAFAGVSFIVANNLATKKEKHVAIKLDQVDVAFKTSSDINTYQQTDEAAARDP